MNDSRLKAHVSREEVVRALKSTGVLPMDASVQYRDPAKASEPFYEIYYTRPPSPVSKKYGPGDLDFGGDTEFNRKFWEFHQANPQIYAHLVELLRDALRRGAKHVGIRMFWEVLRWRIAIRTIDLNSEFKLNDHYHSRYARLISEQEPDLNGLLELRRLRT